MFRVEEWAATLNTSEHHAKGHEVRSWRNIWIDKRA
jgi:hypothetical protein